MQKTERKLIDAQNREEADRCKNREEADRWRKKKQTNKT